MPQATVLQMPGRTCTMGCASGFQPLKSPTTETARAWGAHTVKDRAGVAEKPSEVGAPMASGWQPKVS